MAKTIFVEVVGNASQFKRELTGAVAATNKANSGFSRMGKAAGIAGLALAGGLALGLEKSVKAAMEAQKSTARLDQAFKNSGLSADTYAKRIEATEKSSRKLGFTDEETRNTLAGLMTATGDVGKSMRDLGIAQDVARLKGVDLSTAAKMVTSTLSGNVRSAKALGIVLLPVTTHMDALRAKYKALGEEIPKAEERTAKFADKQATAAEALQRVTDRTHDQAKAFSETAAGGMAEFHAQTQHLEESLGKGLLPAVTNIVGKLSDLASWFSDNPDVAKALVISLAGLATAFLAASAAAFVLENVLTFGIPLAVIAAAAAIGLIATHLQQIGDWIKSHARLLLVVPILGEMLFLGVEIAKHWTAIKGTVTGAMSAISGAVTSSWHAITGAVSTACGAIQSAVAAMVHVVTGLIDKVKSVWESLRTAVGRAIHFLVNTALLDGALAVIHAVKSAWDALRSAASTAIEFVTHQSGSGGIRPAPPHRAAGGPVIGRHAYMVGERGPELFMPQTSGTVVPNANLGGGGGTVVFNFPNYVGDKQELAETMRRELLRIQRRNGTIGFVFKMAFEQLANNATGTLNAAITNVQTSFALGAGQGAAFPSSGNFRIIIDSELMLVGARATDTLSSITRGIEGTAAVSHLINAPVKQELTAAGLLQFVQDNSVQKPASVASGEAAVWNGSAWVRSSTTPLTESGIKPGLVGQFLQTTTGPVTSWGASPITPPTHLTPAYAPNSGGTTFTANTAWLLPISGLTAPFTFTRFHFQNTVTGGNYDFGFFYSDDEITFTRQFSTGTTAVPTASASMQSVTFAAQTLTPIAGRRWYFAFAVSSATSSWSGLNLGGSVVAVPYYNKVTSFPLPSSLTGMAGPGLTTSWLPWLSASI